MVAADAALFTALSHYWMAIARIQRAELEPDEKHGFKEAAGMIQKAHGQTQIVLTHEKEIFSLAKNIPSNAYFMRRHQVISETTDAFDKALSMMAHDLHDGFYPAAACTTLNAVITRMMANIELNSQIEGVLTRVQFAVKAQGS